MRVRWIAVWSCLILAMGLAVGACGDDDEGTTGDSGSQGEGGGKSFTIYSSLPLQGDSRPQSEDVVRGMKLALEQKGGKAPPNTIKYVSLDDASKEFGMWHPDPVKANARRAAGDSNAIAYLGEFNSGASAYSLPIINRAGMLQVSPSNTYVGLTRSTGAEKGEPDMYYPTGKRHYGRVVPADHIQAAAVVSYMQDEGCGDAYILHDGEVPYGKGIANQVERIAGRRGFKILGNRVARPRAVRRVKRSGADCFFFGGITMNGAPDVYKAVGRRSPGIKMFGPDGVAESAFTNELGPKLERRMFITNPTLAPGFYPPRGNAFFTDFEAKYGKPPEPYAIYGYEAMSVVLDSIDNANPASTDPAGRQAVIDAFFRTRGRDSVLGSYDIDPNGDTTLADYGGYIVNDGEVTWSKVINTAPERHHDFQRYGAGTDPYTSP